MHTEINRPKINTPADADSFDNPLIRELQVLRDGVAIGFSQRVEEAKKNPGGAITEGAVAVAGRDVDRRPSRGSEQGCR
jgi:hypothetical protein